MTKATAILTSLLLGGTLLSAPAMADEQQTIMVYKTPTCGCCTKWVSHLRNSGFEVQTTDLSDLRMIKKMSGIEPKLASCHTALVDGYTIEGHVPAADIERLLAERPDAKGLTVPGMPMGSPGMEHPNPQRYQVMLLDNDGNTEVFATH
ncbi:MAG: DUF411 domain-containing protein [Gammaproteobacteria bacterium]